jgi:hypothetical protein
MWQFMQQYLAEPFTSQNCKCELSTISSLAASDSTAASILWVYEILWILKDVPTAIYVFDVPPAIYVYVSMVYFVNIS